VQPFQQIELVLQPGNHALCGIQSFLGLAFGVLGKGEGLPLELPVVIDRGEATGEFVRPGVQGIQLGFELCQLVPRSLGSGCLLTVAICKL